MKKIRTNKLLFAMSGLAILLAVSMSVFASDMNKSDSAEANKSAIPLEKVSSGISDTKRKQILRHIDPLDAGRAMASHRGKNPHGKLTPDQEIKVALQHYQEGRKPEAMVSLNQAISRYPEVARLYDVRATLNLQNGDTTDALADIEKAVQLEPQNPIYRVNRSQVYLKFHREKEAMDDLNKAISINANLVPARFNRGSLLAYQGKNQAAIKDFDQVIALNPHLPAPYFNRGSVYKGMGKTDLAIKDMQNFITITKNKSWKKSAQDLIKAWNEEKEKS